MIQMKNTILIFLTILLISCKKEDLKEDLVINYKGFDVYLQFPPELSLRHDGGIITFRNENEKWTFIAMYAGFDAFLKKTDPLNTVVNSKTPSFAGYVVSRFVVTSNSRIVSV